MTAKKNKIKKKDKQKNNMKIELNNEPAWYKEYEKEGIPKNLDYPDNSIFEFFEEKLKEHSNCIAYDYFNYTSTYKKLAEDIHTCAKALKKLGVEKDEAVTICLPNIPQAIIMFYAINSIGAVANMIHPLSAEGEIKYYLELSKSKTALIVDFAFGKFNRLRRSTDLENIIIASVSDYMPKITSFMFWITKGRKIPSITYNNMVISWFDFLASGKEKMKDYVISRKGDDNAVILYSGGTTGTPKGVMLTNKNFNALVLQNLAMVENIGINDSILGILPLFHGFGLGVGTHTVLCTGATIILIPQFSSKIFSENIKKKKPTFIVGVPTLYEAMLSSKELENTDLSFLKNVISGGDTLTQSLKKKVDDFLFEHGAMTEIREGYGTTECVTASCLIPTNHYKPGSVGIPYPDTFYKIVEPYSEIEVPFNKEGEICISGPTVMKEYINEPKETAQTLRLHSDGKIWLHTGDLGYMDEDGFVFFKLRIKRMIVSSGYNIYPSFIENVIDSHPAVLTSSVVGVPDEYKKQKVKAFIVLQPNTELTDELKDDIKRHCEKNVSKYALPEEYEYKESLPQTLAGKIAYTVLMQESENGEEKKDKDIGLDD